MDKMKKSILMIVLIFLLASTLTAASPRPRDTLQGILQWQRNSVCGVSDYVSTHAMTNVYLTGKFTPTQGLLQGCTILATGAYHLSGHCDFFMVDSYTLNCTDKP